MNCLRIQCVPLHVCYQSPPCHVSIWMLKADAKLSCLCICGKSGREHPPFTCDGQALSPSLMDCVCWITRMLWYLHQSDCYTHGVDTLGTQDGDKDLMVMVSDDGAWTGDRSFLQHIGTSLSPTTQSKTSMGDRSLLDLDGVTLGGRILGEQATEPL